ncbi:MAG: hypothetical protein IPN15_18050 [Saprospiraceae bacterium]|nr:hypothetical protein [Candidatus Vicinibacter affinis]
MLVEEAGGVVTDMDGLGSPLQSTYCRRKFCYSWYSA